MKDVVSILILNKFTNHASFILDNAIANGGNRFVCSQPACFRNLPATWSAFNPVLTEPGCMFGLLEFTFLTVIFIDWFFRCKTFLVLNRWSYSGEYLGFLSNLPYSAYIYKLCLWWWKCCAMEWFSQRNIRERCTALFLWWLS